MRGVFKGNKSRIGKLRKLRQEVKTNKGVRRGKSNSLLEVKRMEVVDRNKEDIALILKQKLQELYKNSKGKPTIIQRDEKGYLVLGKTKAGISMRQMYLEEKGYDFE